MQLQFSPKESFATKTNNSEGLPDELVTWPLCRASSWSSDVDGGGGGGDEGVGVQAHWTRVFGGWLMSQTPVFVCLNTATENTGALGTRAPGGLEKVNSMSAGKGPLWNFTGKPEL